MDGIVITNQGAFNLVLGLVAAAAFYFLLMWLVEVRRLRSMDYIEARNARIDDELRRESRGGPRQRLAAQLQEYGYTGDPTPFLVGFTFVYVLVAATLSAVGLGELAAVVVGLFVAVLAVWAGLQIGAARRTRKGTEQFQLILRAAISHLEAGSTPQQAFTKAAYQVGAPVRDDILRALSAQVGSVGMGAVMAPLAQRYPSQATQLTISALEINDQVGAPLVPALKQAEQIIATQTELAAEALAEISSSRSEFIGISVVISIVAMTLASQDVAQQAYTNPVGATVIALAAANYLAGIWRTLQMFATAQKGAL